MSDEIVTVQEVAALPKVKDRTDTIAPTAQIPAFKVRGHGRFRRTGNDACGQAPTTSRRDVGGQHE